VSESRFRVIEGGGKPKRHRVKKRGAAEQLTCWQCEKDTGVATSATTEIRLSPFIRDGRQEGGVKAIVCAYCLARGTITKLI
jgi:hypothetical protein